MEQAKKILKSHNLKITPTRIAILNVFLTEKNALSASQIKKNLIIEFDRITLYRTLLTFETKGIIHKISSPDGIVRYAICTDNCPAEQHNEKHLHFYCYKCGKIYCEEDTDISGIQIKSGFYIESIQIIAEGLCKDCYKN